MNTQDNFPQLSHDIEEYIDKHSLCGVLEAIADICFAKSEHIRTNWQDEDLALIWERAGNQVLGATTRQYISKL